MGMVALEECSYLQIEGKESGSLNKGSFAGVVGLQKWSLRGVSLYLIHLLFWCKFLKKSFVFRCILIPFARLAEGKIRNSFARS